MGKEEKSRKNANFNYPNLPKNDKDFLVEAIGKVIREKYGLSLDDLFKLVKEEISIPISIFNDKLTVLESVVKFLKEEKELSLSNIGKLLKRNEKNIWHAYDQTKKKYSKKFTIAEERFAIPVSIFSKEKLSAQESIVVYLREKLNFSYHKIALVLKRDDRTIWTVYQRAREKNVK